MGGKRALSGCGFDNERKQVTMRIFILLGLYVGLTSCASLPVSQACQPRAIEQSEWNNIWVAEVTEALAPSAPEYVHHAGYMTQQSVALKPLHHVKGIMDANVRTISNIVRSECATEMLLQKGERVVVYEHLGAGAGAPFVIVWSMPLARHLDSKLGSPR
ncbi:hypothetical protein D3C85_610770 [compost metagenome]